METVTGRVWFRRSWLDDHAIDPTRCVVIGVRGDSMHPTLVDGCSILVDRARVRRRAGHIAGHIYVIRTGDGLLAKRLGKDEAGGWMHKSDNQVEPARVWSDDQEIGEIIGRVLRTARLMIVDGRGRIKDMLRYKHKHQRRSVLLFSRRKRC